MLTNLMGCFKDSLQHDEMHGLLAGLRVPCVMSLDTRAFGNQVAHRRAIASCSSLAASVVSISTLFRTFVTSSSTQHWGLLLPGDAPRPTVAKLTRICLTASLIADEPVPTTTCPRQPLMTERSPAHAAKRV